LDDSIGQNISLRQPKQFFLKLHLPLTILNWNDGLMEMGKEFRYSTGYGIKSGAEFTRTIPKDANSAFWVNDSG
jgi:hypothetical protein